jgi:hypothetical protein
VGGGRGEERVRLTLQSWQDVDGLLLLSSRQKLQTRTSIQWKSLTSSRTGRGRFFPSSLVKSKKKIKPNLIFGKVDVSK